MKLGSVYPEDVLKIPFVLFNENVIFLQKGRFTFDEGFLFDGAHGEHFTQIAELDGEFFVLVSHSGDFLIDYLVFLCHLLAFLVNSCILAFGFFELYINFEFTRFRRLFMNLY